METKQYFRYAVVIRYRFDGLTHTRIVFAEDAEDAKTKVTLEYGEHIESVGLAYY